MNNAAPMVVASQAPVPTLIDSLWQVYARNIISGLQYDIDLPNHFANIIGQEGIAMIATRFR